MLLADYQPDVLTGMGIVACTVGASLLCLCVAGAIRRGATDVAFRRRAVRTCSLRLVSAASCAQSCPPPPVFWIWREHHYQSFFSMSDLTQESADLHEWSVLTIRGYRDIDKAIKAGFIEFTENVAWTTAAKQLRELDRDKTVLPVLLADSTSEQLGIMAWGIATKISITGTQTRVRLEDVQEIPARPVISSLWCMSTEAPLSQHDQRNYRIVDTPKFLFTDPKTFVLTWKPEVEVPMERFLEIRQHLLDGLQFQGDWSCYSVKKVCAGDCFIMLRTGDTPRGIVGWGWIRSNGKRREDGWKHIDILWQWVFDPDAPLDLQTLPGMESFRAPQGSGVELDSRFHDIVWQALERRLEDEDQRFNADTSESDSTPSPSAPLPTSSSPSPELAEDTASSLEGRLIESWSTRRERDPDNRARCLAIHKEARCAVCEMNFLEEYGEIGRDFIHVHHEHPLGASNDNTGDIHDPENAMKPVCPNCHAMLHRGMDARKGEVRSIAALRSIRSQARRL